jgi:cholesterol oxidase
VTPPASNVDWVVIGSGFGGSVAALRLAEKGYSVAVLEAGRRFGREDLPRSASDLRRLLWAPRLGMHGILKVTPFKHVITLTGAGVGGGSLVYGNTLYRAASEDFYSHPSWAGLQDWRGVLAPHYDTVERMLGVVEWPDRGPVEQLLADVASDLGVADSYHPTRVGVFLGLPGVEVPDPYFGGAGPTRAGCTRCGQCMLGCPVGAKNTLDLNYLHLAERAGARIHPQHHVTNLTPAGADDGSGGWVVSYKAGPRSHQLRAGGVVVAAGALGTNQLLRRCVDRGSLPRLSPRLGESVRTNSETLTAVSSLDPSTDLGQSIAIGASLHPDAHTHATTNTYGNAGDLMRRLFAPLPAETGRFTVAGLIGERLRHPVRSHRAMRKLGWSRRSVIFTVMQDTDTALRFVASRRPSGLQTTAEGPPPGAFLPAAEALARAAAARLGGVPLGSVGEAIAGIPTTAHLLGGATIGVDASTGVVDGACRAHGYQGLLICDGSVLPANPGVNPSLTIAAVAEHAMTQVPNPPIR